MLYNYRFQIKAEIMFVQVQQVPSEYERLEFILRMLQQ